MPDLLWTPSTGWDTQPQKKRRITIEDLEQDFLKLSLTGNSWEKVELDTLLQTLTLSPSPARSSFRPACQSGPTAPREAESCCKTDDRSSAVIEVVSMRDDHAAECSTQSLAIVPFHKPPRQRRWRRIPRISSIPRCLSAELPSFAVDSQGTAFLLPEAVRSGISRARDKWKRTYSEEQRNVTSTAIVIYQKPRKHDLVEDFMTLKL